MTLFIIDVESDINATASVSESQLIHRLAGSKLHSSVLVLIR